MAGLKCLLSLQLSCAFAANVALPIGLHLKRTVDSGLANIHISYNQPVQSEITFTYGHCQAQIPGEAHHFVGHSTSCDDDRLLWKVPEYAPKGECISAWVGERLMGRSSPVPILPNKKTARRRLKKRQDRFSIPMDNSSGIDAEGPWFDGVVLLHDKEISAVNVKEAKSKEIAIVGAGMAGLMTWLALNESGMMNLSLIEASQRLGGRVYTAYFGDPSDRQYQEMGPMRIPLSFTSSETNETIQIQDHQVVFQFANEINSRNQYDPNVTVEFIKWYQKSPNGLYYVKGARKPNGQVPTVSEVKLDASLLPPVSTHPGDPKLDELRKDMGLIFHNDSFMNEMARNIYKAHKDFLDSGLGGLGGDDFSEFAFVHNLLGFDLHETFLRFGDSGSEGFWDSELCW